MRGKTTKLARREGYLPQPGSARKLVTVHAGRPITPQDKSQEPQRRLRLRRHPLTLPADLWESARFTSIFLASSFSCSQTESTPAPAPVTQTVRRLEYMSRVVNIQSP